MTSLRQVQTNRSFTAQALFLLVASSLLSFAANAQELSTQSTVHTKDNQSGESVIPEALRMSFGYTVEQVTGFKPNYLSGDFNGDGVQDLLIVVRIRGHRSELPNDVKVLNPFGYGAKPTFPADPSAKPKLAIAILHGSRPGWRNSRFTGKYLLIGDSPVLILENSRATSAHAEDRNNLMEIIRKRGKRARGAERPPAGAKGDAILLATEAAESILYWNGKTFRWKESEGGE